MHRMLWFVVGLTVLLELSGTIGLYGMWSGQNDPNFASAADDQWRIVEQFVQARTDTFGVGVRTVWSLFHAASAWCNNGLSISSDSLMAYRFDTRLYAVVLPLMFLGSLGGVVCFELWRRFRGGPEGRVRLSPYAWLCGTAAIVSLIVGTAALVTIERTHDRQLRVPRDQTPGRLILATTQAAPTTHPERSIHQMNGNWQIASAVFHCQAARSAGFHATRTDESSLTPASHLLLKGLMLLGGGLAGMAGGIGLPLVLVLVVAMVRRRKMLSHQSAATRVVARAGCVVAAMFALSGTIAFVLVYREPHSVLACGFEAVSGVCNVGLSTGITTSLSLVGKSTLTAGMLLGRLLPMLLLLGLLNVQVFTLKPTEPTTRRRSINMSVDPEEEEDIDDDDSTYPLSRP
jgi:trk system potassium uptake protein TrkH